MSDVTLEGDELEVLRMVEGRLKQGRRDYGLLELDSDRRDHIEESVEEALDLCVYIACRLLKLRRRLEGKA